jgi:hypothetical protein
MWPEEELEDSVCDVTCAVVTAIFRVEELIVVTNSEDPINRFLNPNSRFSHRNTRKYASNPLKPGIHQNII